MLNSNVGIILIALATLKAMVHAQHADIVKIPCRDPKNFDPSTCLFAGDHCDFNANFSLFYDQVMPYDKYIADPSPERAEFVVESGIPRIQSGNLSIPLLQRNQPSSPTIGVATIVSTTRFLHYGLFEATFKVPGRGGTVTSFIGYSNEKDEIDLEITGYDNVSVQANWYYRGMADIFASNGSSVNGFIGKVNTSVADYYHTYTLNWTQDSISWFINGRLMHQSTKKKDGKKGFPDTPMRISFGIWQAQPNSTWAGVFDNDWSQTISTHFSSFRVSCLDGPHRTTKNVSGDQLTHPPTGYSPENPYGLSNSASFSSFQAALILNLVIFSLSVVMVTSLFN